MGVDSAFPPFFHLQDCLLRHIFNLSGNLSTLAPVCKLFERAAFSEAQDIYDDIVNTYGLGAVDLVLVSLTLEDKSLMAKIDALFHRAKRQWMEGGDRSPNLSSAASQRPYHLSWLSEGMQLIAEAKGLECLWEASLLVLSSDLRAKMPCYSLGSDRKYLEEMRALFQAHREELRAVKELSLEDAGLIILPREIGLFTNLKTLDLSGNELDELPSEIFCLDHLEFLNASGNRLESIPLEIGQLSSLMYLYLAENRLETLPDEISNLTRLSTLDVDGNSLYQVPQGIGNLSSLRCLRLGSNRLTLLPPEIGDLKCLERLYLYNNQIESLPSSIEGLNDLALLSAACNQLTELPDEIGALKSLEVLMLDHNSLRVLPESIVHLPNLQELYLSNNQIFKLPVLPKLKYFGFEKNPCEHPVVKMLEKKWEGKSQFGFIYPLLGDSKWKECIDGQFHRFGRRVFDEGKHGSTVEPGYLSGMRNLCQFLFNNWQRRLDASFYLEMHRVGCAHFQGAATHTLIGQEQVGIFRKEAVKAHFPAPKYAMSQGGMDEFSRLNNRLEYILGSPFCQLGEISIAADSPTVWCIDYQSFKKGEVEIVFNFFISQFHCEMLQASSLEEGQVAIAKLIQRLEWLHPTKDGTGRTDTALLNFLLSKYGCNPVLLEFPYKSSCTSLDEWVDYLRIGMQAWWREVNSVQNPDQQPDLGGSTLMEVSADDEELTQLMQMIPDDDSTITLLPMSIDL